MNPHGACGHPPPEEHPMIVETLLLPSFGSSSKGRVPCYYFFQGYCAKGGKSLVMHAPPFGRNQIVSTSQKTAKVASSPLNMPDAPAYDLNFFFF